MRAINHALTGAIIGLAVGEPLVAVPSALVSHFLCDMIPHYDGVQPGEENKLQWIRSKSFRYMLYADAALCVSLVMVLALRHPAHWQLAAVCAFIATSPDLLYIRRYLQIKARKSVRSSRLVQWTIGIQWFQRPIGAVVEVAWFIGAVALLVPFLR
jgi:hypothetical protein